MARKPIDPLGHPLRVAIVMLLEEAEATPPEIRSHLPIGADQATVAYHLAILERAELVKRIDDFYRRV